MAKLTDTDPHVVVPGVADPSMRYYANGTPQTRVWTKGTDPDGALATYHHNEQGQILDVSVKTGSVTVPYASYVYNADGQQTYELIAAAGGASRSWVLDAVGRPTSFTESLHRPDNTWDTYTAVASYRADGRIATEKVNAGPTTTYGYDAGGQLTSANNSTVNRSWTYGTRGNRRTYTLGSAVTTYAANPNASVASATTGSTVVSYAYDDAGRRSAQTTAVGGVASRSVMWGFTLRGMETAITTVATGETTKVENRSYDGDGLISSTEITGDGPAKTWHYQWDTAGSVPQVIDTKAFGAIWSRATWGNERIGYKVGTADALWFQYDLHGSAIRNDDTNTALVDGPPGYTPYGQPTGAVSHVRSGYRGELTSGDLVYLRNRNYDPDSGQFTTPDPLDGINGTPTVANPYHYSDNDPLNKTDPMGLRSDDLVFEDPCSQHGPGYSVNDQGQCGIVFHEDPIPGGLYDKQIPYYSEQQYCLKDGWDMIRLRNGDQVLKIAACWLNKDLAGQAGEASLRYGASSAKWREVATGIQVCGGCVPDGSRLNAFLHMTINAYLMWTWDEDTAKGFADRHEMINEGETVDLNDRRNRGMDLANNYYGRELAKPLLGLSWKNFKVQWQLKAAEFVENDRACWRRLDETGLFRGDFQIASRCGQ